ncbi:hypothetical protein M011DRAFT_137558 [Sporormia fimetaria CBS 119925]|uniref:SRR1-like domain-containing protein n=1 Tax=Sporormia fimetaria CBS 119925 TaxID=1340428 RepID=A0A6A6V623_9PLEO|nr:hypothetical protein M011DRAFT_137558 [Sporormia fimetaria CBS 119925]
MKDYNMKCKQFKETVFHQHLIRVLSRRNWRIETAFFIGSGSFCADWEHRYRSMWQLVMFMVAVEYLRKTNPTIQLLAQEPRYTSLDTNFLTSLNFTLPSEEGAETHQTRTSFLFAPFLDNDALLFSFLAREEGQPCLYIGNEVRAQYSRENFHERLASDAAGNLETRLKEAGEIGKRFMRKRRVFRLPEFEGHGNALNGIVVQAVFEAEEDEEDDGT